MAVKIVVPQLGESVVEATVGTWHKKVGDVVAMGDILVALETDKVDVEVGAEASGVLAQVLHAEGDDVKVGDVLAIIEGAEATAVAPTAPASKPTAVPEPTPVAATGVAATPVAKRIADDKGVDVSQIAGTGPGSRVTKQDVQNYLQKQTEPAPAKPTQSTAAPLPTPTPSLPFAFTTALGRSEERVKMSRRRRTIAKRLVEAQHTAAMLTTFNEIDMTAVMDIRQRRQEAFVKKHGIKVGFSSFFVKAAVGALKAFPRLNAEIQEEEMILKRYYDIGIAVGAEEGLVVPVLRDADRLSFAEIEKQVKAFAQKAQANTLSLEDLMGGTFTITNGGVFGSMLSTPILNPPQVGILGLHNIVERPVAINGQVVIRPIMYVALSYDHRIVDGREAVQFLVRVKELIEDPESLLLDS